MAILAYLVIAISGLWGMKAAYQLRCFYSFLIFMFAAVIGTIELLYELGLVR